MLEAIADFWKPIKKAPVQNKSKLADLQIGSVVSFGYMPQMALSGKKLAVSAINSYQFGADVLTSFAFVLDNSSDSSNVSMIVADAQGEQYLAISRRLSVSDRIRLFADNAVEAVVSRSDVTKLNCNDNVPELKGWLASDYKREIQGMRGFFHRADLRGGSDKLHSGEEFAYTLLGSDSNEHALEIESYPDGRIDIYATIYRRTSDIKDVVNAKDVAAQQSVDVKLVTQNNEVSPVAKALLAPVVVAAGETNLEIVKPEIVKLEEVALPQLTPTPLAPAIEKVAIAKTEIAETEIVKEVIEPKPTEKLDEEKKEMNATATIATENKPFGSNGNGYYNGNGAAAKQEIGTVNKTAGNMDNESINCDLKVANQIIEEAIRNEMRLSDVVRRIIELPVAHQESVQIPFTLSDDDYALLAIRYGIPASDRNAIKTRIIQDLGDFSGNKRK